MGYDPTGFGNYISILQNDYNKALYCHLKSYDVKIGDKIEEGQVIGVMGSTGNSTGPHLHLEIRKSPYHREDYIDVAEYLYIKNENGNVQYRDNYELLNYLGVLDYWGAGYKGQGVTIASRESKTAKHGAKVKEVLEILTPEASILTNIDYKACLNNFDIYTTSLSFGSDKFEKSENKAKELYNKDVFLVCAVGNNSSDSQTVISKNNCVQSIGACTLDNGTPKRAYYSSITNDLDFMSLTSLELSTGVFNGTSCAAPIFASLCALIQCYFIQNTGRKLTNSQLLRLIKDNCIDLDKKGLDPKTGYGLFVLPKLDHLDVKKYLEEGGEDMPRYNTLEEVPEWGQATIEKLINLQVLKGDENGNLNLSYDLLRTFVIHDRLGLYD